MPDGARVLVDLVVVAALIRLVAKEVDSGILDPAGEVLLVFHVLETVCLVPAAGEEVKGDLTADGVAIIHKQESRQLVPFRGVRARLPLGKTVEDGEWKKQKEKKNSRQTKIREFLLDSSDKRLPYAVLQVILLVLVPLGHRRIPANRTDIDHTIPELDKRASLLRQVQVGNVVQDEFGQLFVFLLADPGDEAVRGEGHAHAVGRQTVLGEAKVEEGGYGDGGGAELFLLLDEVGAADEADGDFVAESGEELEHFGGDILCWGFVVSLGCFAYVSCCPSFAGATVVEGASEAEREERTRHTLLAGVRVPSTSNRQMVFLTGRWSSVGMTDGAAVVISVVVFW